MSPYATAKYISLFEISNSYYVVNKLKKSFFEIKTSTTESKTEAEVLKWAQDTIDSKMDEEVRQMLFLNAAKGAAFYISSSSSDSTGERDVQSFLFDIQNFSYDRVNSTFSFNYIINFCQTNYDNVMQVSYSLNYCFENIKIEITTGIAMIKVAELQPFSASISLVNYEVDSYISESLSESAINKNKLWHKIANTRLEAAKEFNEIGKVNGNLTFSSLFDAFQQSVYYKEDANILILNDTILFSSSNIDSFVNVNIASDPTENLNLSTNCWSFLFDYDYYVNLQELESHDNIVVEKVSSSSIATTNIYLVDIDPTTQEQTKLIAYELIK